MWGTGKSRVEKEQPSLYQAVEECSKCALPPSRSGNLHLVSHPLSQGLVIIYSLHMSSKIQTGRFDDAELWLEFGDRSKIEMAELREEVVGRMRGLGGLYSHHFRWQGKVSFHGYGGVDIAEGLSSPAIHPQDSRLVQLLSLQMTSKVYLQA